MPKSNRAALATKRANWTGIGSLRPSSWRSLHPVLERGVLADHLVDGIADEAEQRERDQRHRQHDHDRLEQPADGEGEHRSRRR